MIYRYRFAQPRWKKTCSAEFADVNCTVTVHYLFPQMTSFKSREKKESRQRISSAGWDLRKCRRYGNGYQEKGSDRGEAEVRVLSGREH